MAYKLISGPSFSSLPTDIIDFALNTLGWTSEVTGRIIMPGSDAGISVAIDTYVQGTDGRSQRLRAQLMDGEAVQSTTYCVTPYIGNVFQNPSVLHLFGSNDVTAPYLAAVIEYGAGFFRHMYVGRLSKFGNYTGGEVMCGSSVYVYNNHWFRDNSFQYLFDGMQTQWTAASSGAVRLTHADLGGTIYAPFLTTSTPASYGDLTPNAVFGGFKNNINDQQVARAQSTFAGIKLFTPINLYLSRASNMVTPIGMPPGVRLINMTDIGPATEIVVANKNWRCFPQFKKGDEYAGGGGSGTNMLNETSWMVGLAYVE